MTKNEARVAIAKDVLNHLEVLNPVWGGVYIDGRVLASMWGSEEDAQKNIDFIGNTCSICALGACMLSYARLFNNLKIGELGNAHTHLQKYFSEHQLHLIEQTYEGWYGECCENEHGDLIPFTIEEKRAMLALHNKYESPKELLQAIMKNIIENDGTFIP